MSAPGAVVVGGSLTFPVTVPAKRSWTASVQVVPGADGQERAAPVPLDTPLEHAVPVRRMRRHREAAPAIRTEDPGVPGRSTW